MCMYAHVSMSMERERLDQEEIHQFLVIECQPQGLHSREKINGRCLPSGWLIPREFIFDVK